MLDQHGKAALAFTRINESGRGRICTIYLIASPLTNDPSIGALLDSVENTARKRACTVMEIIAVPAFANRIHGKLTNVIFGRDLSVALSVN